VHEKVHKKGLENHARAKQKMKHMVGKHDAWCGAMVWPHHAPGKNWRMFSLCRDARLS